MKVEAVVFDMDGTIVDTGNLWIKSALKVNEEYGFDYSVDEIKTYIGTGKKDDYCSLIKQVFNEKIESGELEAKKGFFELFNYLKKKNIKIALATSSKLEKVKKRFASAGVDINAFDQIISGEMVEKNKPDPEIYQKACHMLDANPETTIAIEDSGSGILSATGAGLKAILVPDVCVPSEKTLELAHIVCGSLEKVKEFID